jgi:asparagine synthase (glutamine-hydrolysing)
MQKLNRLETEIKTGYQKGFQWTIKENIWFIGYFYDRNDNHIIGENAIKIISDLVATPDLEKQIGNINGVFSCIILLEKEVILFSDKSRFFPLFYSQINDKLLISDDFYYLVTKQAKCSFNNDSVTQFLSGAFVSGSDTVVSNISQVRPSEIVCFSNDSVKRKYTSTFSVSNKEFLTCDESKLEDLALKKFKKAGLRLAKSITKKQVLLPLSGGYDSRLIACWLKENKVENVTCFTFGRKDTAEIEISRKVAEQLNFEWHYIEYKPEMVDDYIHSDIFREYYKYASRGTSMFYMQEYFAMLELRRKKILGDKFVALPGHSGDFLGGSQLHKVVPPKNYINNPDQILLKKSFWQQPISAREKQSILVQIQNQLKEIKETFNADADYSIIEDWLIKERIIKYVFNSSQIFTFFGGEVRFPFWDNELYDFWKTVPCEYRLHKKLYNNVLQKKYFEPYQIDFGSNLQPKSSDLTIQKLKNNLKQYLPYPIKDKFRKKNDWVLYDEITQPMLKELSDSGIMVKDNSLSYLHRILNWYLYKIEKEFDIIY